MSNASSLQSALVEALPDLALLLRRDGVVLAVTGGQGLGDLKLTGEWVGKNCDAFWPPSVADVVKRLTLGAIGFRKANQARFEHLGHNFEALVYPQGPNRALCILRSLAAVAADDSLDSTDIRPRPHLDRRGFLRRFKESTALATLCEKPAALIVIHLEGLSEIAQAFDSSTAEQVTNTAMLRLSLQSGGATSAAFAWYLGQLSEDLLGLVAESAERDVIRAWVSALCVCLREPVSVGDAVFHLTPHAGVAILGQDATSSKIMLEHARAAATEAHRSGSGNLSFFTDTVKLRALARFDVARELRAAIDNREIRLRYTGRYDLASGRLVTWVGYLSWVHPARGEVRPEEFLRVAETTGLAVALSRAALSCVKRDFVALAPQWDSDTRISFGALRHHITQPLFKEDIEHFLADGVVPANRLELRIAEKAFIARDSAVADLQGVGVQWVVDEVGRGLGSLDALARAPIMGLQLDRAWARTVRTDEVALKVCRAGIAVATALGLTPIATGVDNEGQRQILLDMGCRFGMGDLYRDDLPNIMRPYPASASKKP
jgi:EAL domain-containing protein (putative c-di-GMP-specific phosphodiesterase class I)/GGDEF domain-containing protein